ncbi:MAG: hypothetical protein ACR2KJ_12540 [Jatrophihabitans sp.]
MRCSAVGATIGATVTGTTVLRTGNACGSAVARALGTFISATVGATVTGTTVLRTGNAGGSAVARALRGAISGTVVLAWSTVGTAVGWPFGSFCGHSVVSDAHRYLLDQGVRRRTRRAHWTWRWFHQGSP